jgi:hypothetical protein
VVLPELPPDEPPELLPPDEPPELLPPDELPPPVSLLLHATAREDAVRRAARRSEGFMKGFPWS